MEVQELMLQGLPKAQARWDGDALFGVTLSLAIPARDLRGGRAAASKDLERAELLWPRARAGWCVRGCHCHLPSWEWMF